MPTIYWSEIEFHDDVPHISRRIDGDGHRIRSALRRTGLIRDRQGVDRRFRRQDRRGRLRRAAPVRRGPGE